MDLITALLAAIGALATTSVTLFWLYVRHRDKDEAKYQSFTQNMIPLLTDLKNVSIEMTGLVRKLLYKDGGGDA